ncbi:MAG TPA: exopolysaccharide biosynthesis polyprenyl glycosylphosphotransferase [Anaerolineales bacterium]|nr:exopolysaccharide biosynthesis polyprenyl glycosylphosphotransferase [Anaerolineales bacterium]
MEPARSQVGRQALTTTARWRLRPIDRRPLLVLGDFTAGALALVGALYLWGVSGEEWLGFSREFLAERVQTWFYFIPFIWIGLMVEMYDIHRAARWRTTLRGVALAALIGLGVYLVAYFSSPPRSLPRSAVGYFLALVFILTLAWRAIYIRVFNTAAFLRRALVIGGGAAGTTLLAKLNELEPAPFVVTGVIDDDPGKAGGEVEGFPVLGGAGELKAMIADHQVTDVIVSISGPMEGRMFQALLDAQEQGVEIGRMQRVYEDMFGRVPIFHLESDWMVRSFVEESRVNAFYLVAKRLLDLLGGLLGTAAFLIILPFVTLANLAETGFPILYLQTRSGKNDRRYEVIKFRTMVIDAEGDGTPRWTAENDERVTKVGWFLRKTHLDELPQFFNVLKGEMSLVGPRPERPALIKLFQEHVPFYRARLLVKPGLTGWAQIHQVYAANVEETNEKLEYDLYYIKHRSILLDLLILLRTPATILGLRGR